MQAETETYTPSARLDRADGVLLLCHRIPFPPDKGDKIRSKRWLDALTSRYRVYLGAFVDDPRDWEHLDSLERICEEVLLVGLSPTRAKLLASAALLTGRPLSVACYRSGEMMRWVQDILRRGLVARIVIYSSAMAQYAVLPEAARARKIIDFVDVDSDKWRQYARRTRWPMSWVYALEAKRLLTYDARAAEAFDAGLFVSEPEAALFRRETGTRSTLQAVPNGVDAEYFAPSSSRASPFSDKERAVVFTGAMSYWANIDAVRWFVAEVWPIVRAQEPAARFFIVGARPAKEVLALAAEDVIVTGRVSDVRPYLQHAAAVVAPMRIARGIQNKVLEGMAMARVVLTTSMGAEGIPVTPGEHLLVEDDAQALALRLLDVFAGGHCAVGAAARAYVRTEWAWEDAKARFLSVVAGAERSAGLSA